MTDYFRIKHTQVIWGKKLVNSLGEVDLQNYLSRAHVAKDIGGKYTSASQADTTFDSMISNYNPCVQKANQHLSNVVKWLK